MSTLELENIKHPDNSGNNLTLTSGGNVGIGETNPLGKLHVKSADSGATADVSADEFVIEGSGNSGMSILSGASNTGSIYFGDSGTNWDGYIAYSHNDRKMTFGTAAGGGSVNIDSSGRVKIGTNETTIGDQQLFISGTKTSFATLGYSLWQNQLAVHDNRVPSGGAGTEAGVGGSISFTANAGGGQKTWLGLVEGYKQNSTAGDYGGGLKMRVRQHNNPTMLTGISINSNGHVTTPNQPALNCRGNGGAQTSGAVITSWIEVTDRANNHSNGRFTAPTAGFYLVTYGIRSQNSSSTMYAQLWKNGAGYAGASAIETLPGMNTEHHMGGTQLYLNQNDYIELYAGNNVWIDGSDHFSVSLIG